MSRREPHRFEAPKDGAKVFWKSLEDKANPAAAQKRAESEFSLGLEEAKALTAATTKSPQSLVTLRKAREESLVEKPVGRRGFLFFAGASAALAAEGCARRPVEKILPYSKAPEHVLPGTTEYYASVIPARGDAIGVLVESHEGRPTKIEGNPSHPSSLGATDLWTQGAIYDLYDPDRGTTPLKGSRQSGGGFGDHKPASWNEFDQAFTDLLRTAQADGGARLRILAAPTTSPTFVRLRDAIRTKLPQAKVYTYTPASDSNAREGARLAFGQLALAVPSFDKAKVILALDSDFLHTETGSVRANKGFSEGRKLRQGAQDDMNRLYVVEPAFTSTGMTADHRLRLPAQDIERYLLALAAELKADIGGVKADATGFPAPWIKALAADLTANKGKSLIVVGARQPARVHALAHAVNGFLGNVEQTVSYMPVVDTLEVDSTANIKALAAEIEKSSVGTLIILGGEPALRRAGRP